MTEPYLILHKVRNEPAFDIAERLEIDSEEAWIIPTSGHRAYPLGTWCLEDIYKADGCSVMSELAVAFPEGWPDHYSCNDRPLRNAIETGRSILAAIGLTPSASSLKRRKF